MNGERLRNFILTLPHVVETEQWGGLIFWVGDKAIGGKMFVMMNPEVGQGLPMSYSAGPERFDALQEIEGVVPAPYMARIHWVAVERWDVFRMAEWEDELTRARDLTYAKMPPKVKTLLDLPKAELKKAVAERRKLLAVKAAAKAATKKRAAG